MKKMNLTAAVLALLMTASLCACGEKDSSAAANTTAVTASSSAETSKTTADTKTTPTAESGTKAAADISYGEKPPASDELATVQYIADTYFKARDNKDAETLTDVMATELMYYITNSKAGDRAAQVAFAADFCKELPADPNREVSKPEKKSDYADAYNSFFKVLDKENNGTTELAKTFKVEDAYYIMYKATGVTMDMPIIKINGEWKLDPEVSMLMSFYDIAESLGTTT